MMAPDFEVAIIGAGMGGVGLGMRLLKAGEQSFLILERAERLGGTWRDNSYPGCCCDVPSHLYWFDFDEQPDWSRLFAPQAEILSHMEAAVERAGLNLHIRLNTEVTDAVWDEDGLFWHVTTADGATFTARMLVSACGQLGQPSYRNIPGRERFKGVSFHSARWRHDVDLTGKKVICIGSGASAAQIVPEVAKVAGHLTVIQRSAPYVIPREDKPYTEEERALFRSDPEKLRESRAAIFADLEQRFETLKPGSEGHVAGEQLSLAHLEAQISDPALRAKLTPNYTLGCKRPVISDDYLPTFTRPNVTLVTEAVESVEETGVRTGDGALHEADVIIFATGFESLKFLDGINIRGRDGRSLHDDVWADTAKAYLGMTVTGFPNFFILYGPNTNLNHNSIIAMFDAQFEYVVEALEQLKQEPEIAFDLKADRLRSFNRTLQQGLATSAFVSGCNSWYRDEEGRIVTNWWGTVTAYRQQATHFNPEDYEAIESPIVLAGDE